MGQTCSTCTTTSIDQINCGDAVAAKNFFCGQSRNPSNISEAENSRLQDDLMISLPEINLKVDKYEKESFYSDVVKKSQNFTNKDFEPFDEFSRRSKASVNPEKTVISHKLSTAIRKHEGSMMQS